jgi:hypothetical protein
MDVIWRVVDMKHPLDHIPNEQRRVIFIIGFVMTIAVMISLNISGKALSTPEVPSGIITYEFAADEDDVRDIFHSWAEHEPEPSQYKVIAGFNLGLDFLYLPAYSTTIAMGILWITRSLFKRRSIILAAVLLAWGQWVAAVLDIVENVALYKMLLDGPTGSLPQVASICALIKFILVGVGLAYVVVTSLLWLIRRFR